jgi:hypothetical protein
MPAIKLLAAEGTPGKRRQHASGHGGTTSGNRAFGMGTVLLTAVELHWASAAQTRLLMIMVLGRRCRHRAQPARRRLDRHGPDRAARPAGRAARHWPLSCS